ncbi:syndecan-1 [Numida meleagris]|uniref:syndecan-1 n=1 Tax=Numida meleagris TaxID=8996 RepID=UPI000B3DF9BC|nr:syndecan-1 [Numida meleagris]
MLRAVAVLLAALCFHAAVPQTTNLNLPPEDLDSSGDDDDGFSGSGAGPLTDQSLTWRMPAEPTNSSLLATPVLFSEHLFPGIESRTEKKVTGPPATSRAVTEEPMVAVKDEVSLLGSPDEKPTKDAVVTTARSTTARSPTTDLPSVLHVIPSEASGTVHELEPKTPGSELADTKDVPETKSTIHPEGDIAAAPTTAPGSVVPTPEEVSEDGSGDPGDFILIKDEDLVPTQNSEVPADSGRNAKAAGASGIMDRKEVLGGVIAGGLVGLVFAVFLVAFMLYRMKKKDEGSYSLDEPKQSNGGYQKPHKQEEFYA